MVVPKALCDILSQKRKIFFKCLGLQLRWIVDLWVLPGLTDCHVSLSLKVRVCAEEED